MRVIDCMRLLRPVVETAAGLGSVTRGELHLCRASTTLSAPAPSTRTSAGCADGALTTHDRDERVVRVRMDGDIANRDLRRVGADERGDLLVERRGLDGAGGAGRPAR